MKVKDTTRPTANYSLGMVPANHFFQPRNVLISLVPLPIFIMERTATFRLALAFVNT
jgi:hypothetical protein